MALKDILVVVGPQPKAAFLDTAAGFALRHDAHVTGLFVMAPPRPIAGELSEHIIEAQIRSARKVANEAQQMFRDRMDLAGVGPHAQWRLSENHPVLEACAAARCADVVVVAQTDETGWEAPQTASVDGILFGGGRPVLVVPRAGQYPAIGDNVLIAWNASREATRAVHDALPLLDRAKTVTVLSINPSRSMDDPGDLPVADIANHLARHGLTVEGAKLTSKELNPGDLLLNEAADRSADLLVMGAYGHSRLRELVLGGMTRHVMSHMTLPVLFSH